MAKLVDEAQNAIDQLNTAQANVKASGDPDTSSEQAKVNTAQATLDSDEIKIAKDDITRWQNEKAACDAIIKNGMKELRKRYRETRLLE